MSEQPHYVGHRKRLRERLRKDSAALADYELLELLLGYVNLRKDTKPTAKDLLARFKTIRGCFDAYPAELNQVPGFGGASGDLWLLLREFMARYAEAKARERPVLDSIQDVADMARTRLANCTHEEVWLALLNARNRLITWERVMRGSISQVTIHPRDVLEVAIRNQASALILVHNHPGGSPEASGPDVEVTRQIARAGKQVGIRVLDHLIVTDEECHSMHRDGLLE